MTIVSNLAFIDDLRETHLLPAEKIDQLLERQPERLIDARALARIALQQGWLTVYQINRLLAGHGRELVAGPFHILDLLGRGGQSTVYKARHVKSGSVVALKVIRAELMNNPECIEQFKQEMEAMAKLNHPNVVRFFDADRLGEVFYCALEYIEGTDLGKYVRLAGPLPAAEACDYIRQTALGLQHAYERNLIHRDIKPVNLSLTGAPTAEKNISPAQSGVIKILDWGLANIRLPKNSPQIVSPSGTKLLIGTADYLSPEQAIDPDAVDIRGDIYSLGCTFYYLLAGHPPFPEGKVMQKILAHQTQEPTPINKIRTDLPPGLAAVVKRMLAKKPQDRYHTPAAVALPLKPYSNRNHLKQPLLARAASRPRSAEPNSSANHTPMPEALRAPNS